MEEKKIKRLLVDVSIDLHQQVKMFATRRNISIGNWLQRAILERIQKELRENKDNE